MGYQKNSDDNGRVGGTFDDFTTEHVVGKFGYGDRDRSGNDKAAEDVREWETDEAVEGWNDDSEIVEETTSEGAVRADE